MICILFFVLIVVVVCLGVVWVDDYSEVDDDVFKVWVDVCVGIGVLVYWVFEGGIFVYLLGEKLFGMVGFDSLIVIWLDDFSEKVIYLM